MATGGNINIDDTEVLAAVYNFIDGPNWSTVLNAVLLQDEEDSTVAATLQLAAAHGVGVSPVRVEGYGDFVVPRYAEVTFKEHFRLYRCTFQELASRVSPWLTAKVHSVETKVMCFLWLMGNTESFRSVADRFGMSKSTLHLCVSNVADALFHLLPEEVVFPTCISQLHAISRTFEKFPGVIGCVDGTYIPMTGKTGPKRDAYICRKGFPALHAQIVCDNNLKILDITTGYPGSVHDARVFRNSTLYQHLLTLPPNFHLLGDSAYPLESFIMTPYKDNGNMTVQQKKYNAVHSSSRCCVERCIGLLKGKFRRLKNFDAKDDVLMCKLVVATAVVHNVILSREGIETEDISADATDSVTDMLTYCCQSDHVSTKRDKICSDLSVL